MPARCSLIRAVTALALLLHFAPTADAQIRGRLFVSGLSQPVAFVQDPDNAGVQFVVEKAGLIRIIQNGTLLPTPFLDLRDAVATDDERGLVSLAFPPSSQSGRFFVTFANTQGNTVVARFNRSADPLVANAASRFDLQWSTGDRFLVHPYTFHYSGNLVFGADGYLYIGTGDGGEPDDASHQAQNLSSLHGKILRVNVNVDDSDPEGLDIPADNPFIGRGAPEVWDIGFRNPWRFTLDDPARGGTGALLIADVGENIIEEVNYEPAGRGGRNYGWRNREGTGPHNNSLPPAFEPLTNPIYEYDHGTGRSVTGGYVYRGSAIASLRGRYVFGDFVRGRVWSLALTIDGNGEASASDLREHTSEINAGSSVGRISSFGIDSAGELYVVNYSDGTIVSVSFDTGPPPPPPPPPPMPLVQIDTPANTSSVQQPFTLAGWALDATAASRGIDTLHVWAYPASGAAPQFLGVPTYGISRPDVAAAFGPQFGETGYALPVRGLTAGSWTIVVYGWVHATGTFSVASTTTVSVNPSTILVIDTPQSMAEVGSVFALAGWAADTAAASGTGIDTIHVWAFPADGSAPPQFMGLPQFVDRPDVAAYLGNQFRRSGYSMPISALGPGTWDLYVFPHSSVSNVFEAARIVRIVIR